MSLETPRIDSRGAKKIYEQAVKLAKTYCPDWENVSQDIPDEKDLGIVLLILLSRLAETVIKQINRIPEKHLLAFYDLIGIDYLPPQAAKTPLTFKLSKGSKKAVIPARTKIASSDDPAVVFETIEPLSAVNFTIKSAYSVNPWADTYTDHSAYINGLAEGFYIFGGDKREKPMEHALFLADDVFDYKSSADIIIRFYLSDRAENITDYFSICADGDGNPLTAGLEVDRTGTILTANLNSLLIKKTVIDGIENNWVSFKPNPNTPIPNRFPKLTKITSQINASGILPDAALANNAPVDVKKGFYPFGETPKIGDALYIGCAEVFSRKKAGITIRFNIEGSTAEYKPLLSWEYWNGTQWIDLGVKNGTPTFSAQVETLVFQCPDNIEVTEINGISSRWIRARITSGGYGNPGGYKEAKAIEAILLPIKDSLGSNLEKIKDLFAKEGIVSGFKYDQPFYRLPLIRTLNISYTIEEQTVDRIKTLNNFKYSDIKKRYREFAPFSKLGEDTPSLYLGFESDDNLADQIIALYFSLKGLTFDESKSATKVKRLDYTEELPSDKITGFAWAYYRETMWTNLAVKDETELLSKSDVVNFIVPSDMSKQELFGENLYWLKIELKDGSWFEPPRLKGIFPNTVWAEHAQVIQDELLGSSNGNSSQVFYFASKPILTYQIIEVKEPSVPSEEELEIIKYEEGNEAVRLIKNAAGDIESVWVRWHEVNTFRESTSQSRHYLVDRVNGGIIFGDGVNGMIPPALPNNILAREYKSGGGKRGNQKENVIKDLKKALPNIEGVTNHDSSAGGRDLEGLPDVLNRAPHSIKNGGRAVTQEDFEWLAIESSPEVLRAKCIKKDAGAKVVIVPVYNNVASSPKTSLINYVETYLKERAFSPINNNIEVVGPDYKLINIATGIIPLSSSEGEIVSGKVKERLTAFFNPVTGGLEGKGWDFGQNIFISEVAAVIEDVEGMDHITDLTVDKGDPKETASALGNTWITIGNEEFPCVGEITITVNLSGDKA